jgi:hypothetical protein
MIELPGLFNQETKVSKVSVEDAAENLQTPLFEQFLTGREPSPALRASQMGKPALEIAAKYHGVYQSDEDFSDQTKLIFWFGHAFESWLQLYLEKQGYEFCSTQQDYNYEGITGHSDFVVKSPEGQKMVIDAKCVNDRTFEQYRKNGLDDGRGYLTQLAIYSHCEGNIPAAVVMCNKSNGAVSYAWVDPQAKVGALFRCDSILGVLQDSDHIEGSALDKFNYCFQFFRPPEPRVEIHKKEPTGKFLLPDTMRFSALSNVVYDTYTDYNARNELKTYVSDYNYPAEYTEYKPNINEVLHV